MLVSVSMLVGCQTNSNNGDATAVTNSGEKISIVTTIFLEYDWVREITKGNDNVEITMLSWIECTINTYDSNNKRYW